MRETLSYSYNPLTSQTGTRALAHQTPVEEWRPRPIMPFALHVSPATHFSTSFHSTSTSSPSHIDITPPFSHRNIKQSRGSTSSRPRAAEHKGTDTAFQSALMEDFPYSNTVCIDSLLRCCLNDHFTQICSLIAVQWWFNDMKVLEVLLLTS